MAGTRTIVVGAGVGGLACAIDLARRGVAVTLLDRATQVGGKIHAVGVGGGHIDSGPTVLTKISVFEALFRDAGDDLHERLNLERLDVLARHAWPDGAQIDLFADEARSFAAVADFAGAAEAEGYRRFMAAARRTFETLDAPFMQTERPSLPRMLARIAGRGAGGVADMWALQPYASLWRELGRYFSDVRLRQLFARYATYCGGSPFQTPATLMLVAHLEQQGVWRIAGGMQALADALLVVARRLGVEVHTSTNVAAINVLQRRVCGVTLASGDRLAAETVVFNGDVAALAGGSLGDDVARAVPRRAVGTRSLSAVTVSLVGRARGTALSHHNVFFSDAYRREFETLRAGRVPEAPTVYVCAPDHDRAAESAAPQRLFCLINAPANGDTYSPTQQEIDTWQRQTFAALRRCGLDVTATSDVQVSTPSDFHRRFPATGGALYGPAPHTILAAFQRASARTRVAGLYLAGGSLHPGPGVPMAAMSGRLAAQCLLADLASQKTWRPAAMPGGTSTVSATTGSTR